MGGPQTDDLGAAEPSVPPGEEAPRVLRRSRDDRVFGGVAGGLGRYFGIDPILLRIAFVVLVFAGGTGILLYLIGWLVIPEERSGDALGPAPATGRTGGGAELLGLVLIALGAFFLLRLLTPDLFGARYVWPVVLIVLGIALLLRAARR